MLTLLAMWLLAQAPATKPIETAHLTMTTSTATAAGGKVTLNLDVAPRPRMHVYSPGQEGYIAIALTLDADPGVRAGKATYPAGEKYVMPALNETQLVYNKPFRITQDVTITNGAGKGGAGAKTIKGTVRYQACDDSICYLPKTVPVAWTIAAPPRPGGL